MSVKCFLFNNSRVIIVFLLASLDSGRAMEERQDLTWQEQVLLQKIPKQITSNESLKDLIEKGITSSIKQDYVQSKKNFKQAAKQGNSAGLYHLGKTYQQLNIPKLDKAFACFFLSALIHWEKTDSSYQPSIKSLTNLLDKKTQQWKELGDDTNITGWREIIEILTHRKTPATIMNLGMYFDTMDPATRPFVLSLNKISPHAIFLKTIDLYITCNHVDGYFALGNTYADTPEEISKLTEKEKLTRSQKCYEISTHPLAKSNLGFRLLTGKMGLELSAEDRLKKGEELVAQYGGEKGKNYLGTLYEESTLGKHLSMRKRLQKAEDFYKQANIPHSKYNLLDLYLKYAQIFSISTKMQEIKKLYEAIINTKEALTTHQISQMNYSMALAYEGNRLGKNLSSKEREKIALTYAAKSDLPESHILRARIYLGEQITPNDTEATQLLAALKDNNTPRSNYAIGELYYKGIVGKELPFTTRTSKTAKYHSKSTSPLPESYFRIGKLYMDAHLGSNLADHTRYQIAYDYFEKSQIPLAKEKMGWLLGAKKVTLKISSDDQSALVVRLLQDVGSVKAYNLLAGFYNTKSIYKTLPNEERLAKAEEYYLKSPSPESYESLAGMFLIESSQHSIQKGIKYAALANTLMAKYLLLHFYIGIYACPEYQIFLEGINVEEQICELYEELCLKGGDEKFTEDTRKIMCLLGVSSPSDSGDEVHLHPELRLIHNAFMKTQKSKQEKTKEVEKKTDNLKVIPVQSDISADALVVKINEEETSKEKAKHLIQVKQTTNNSTLSKAENKLVKKHRQLQRHLDRLQKEKSKTPSSKKSVIQKPTFTVEFANDKAREEFKNWQTYKSVKKNSKLTEIMNDILFNPFALYGAGKPERLKYVGLFSRRLNQQYRLLYDVQPGRVIIYGCSNHYDKLK